MRKKIVMSVILVSVFASILTIAPSSTQATDLQTHLTNPNLRTAAISVASFSLSATVNSTITMSGGLTDANGTGLSNENILLSYSNSDSDAWTKINTCSTGGFGDFSFQWVNDMAGTFTVKAEWLGNDTFLGVNDTATVYWLALGSNIPIQTSQSNAEPSSGNAKAQVLSENALTWVIIVVPTLIAVAGLLLWRKGCLQKR